MTPHADPVRWGVLAPGAIAALFCDDLALVPDGELVAVGSRDPQRAATFAAKYGAASSGTYEDVLADPDVDVVYVASPHSHHEAHARQALAAGKHVLCEKPLTLDRASASALVETARSADRFLMEAMWMACNPVIRDLAARLAAGDFGEPRHVTASFHFRPERVPGSRLFEAALGGGSLLDIGIYPLTFAHLLLGEAEELRASGVMTDDGVDLDVAIAGRYPGDRLAELSSSITSARRIEAGVATDAGWIQVPSEFHHPASYSFTRPGQDPVTFTGAERFGPVVGMGYGNEIAEVHRCLREGLRESPLVPHQQTLTILGQIDDLRGQLRRPLGTTP